MNNQSYWPDMAAALDEPADELAELARLTPAQRQAAKEWLGQQVEKHVAFVAACMLNTVLTGMIHNGHNVRASLVGLAYAVGLDEINQLGTQADQARKLKVTRALISHYAKFWQEQLDIHVHKGCRTEDASRAYSVRASEVHRRRVWQQEKNQSHDDDK